MVLPKRNCMNVDMFFIEQPSIRLIFLFVGFPNPSIPKRLPFWFYQLDLQINNAAFIFFSLSGFCWASMFRNFFLYSIRVHGLFCLSDKLEYIFLVFFSDCFFFTYLAYNIFFDVYQPIISVFLFIWRRLPLNFGRKASYIVRRFLAFRSMSLISYFV